MPAHKEGSAGRGPGSPRSGLSRRTSSAAEGSLAPPLPVPSVCGHGPASSLGQRLPSAPSHVAPGLSDLWLFVYFFIPYLLSLIGEIPQVYGFVLLIMHPVSKIVPCKSTCLLNNEKTAAPATPATSSACFSISAYTHHLCAVSALVSPSSFHHAATSCPFVRSLSPPPSSLPSALGPVSIRRGW